MKSVKKYESGQALLLVLLSMAVILTIVLSILARSITDVSTSKQDEESLRAFSAAEAGIEQALIAGSISSTDIGSNASFAANVSDFGKLKYEFVSPISNLSGESTTLWFVRHDDDGDITCVVAGDGEKCFKGQQLNICWGTGSETTPDASSPAMEASVFYTEDADDYSQVKIARVTADPYSSRRTNNGFDENDAGSCVVDGTNFLYQKMITFSDIGIPSTAYDEEGGLIYAKIKLFYNNNIPSKVGFSINYPANGDASFPSQGKMIESFGISGDANRKLNVFETFTQAPEIFDSSLFTLGGIVK